MSVVASPKSAYKKNNFVVRRSILVFPEYILSFSISYIIISRTISLLINFSFEDLVDLQGDFIHRKNNID